MRPVVILGSTGMIGSGVTSYISRNLTQFIEVNRIGISTQPHNSVIKFDVLKNDIHELLGLIPRNSIILNFIGLIRHKIFESQAESVFDSSLINAVFPVELVKNSLGGNHKIIQIATDCVFSGKTGSYSESAQPDPIDLYGKSKSDGELASENLMTVRVSVVGKERHSHVELMDWVLNSGKGKRISGYSNHLWNGVTSLQLGKVVYGIIRSDIFKPGTFHLVPRDKTNKYELIRLIAEQGGRPDLIIEEILDSKNVDRTLTTNFSEFNSILWGSAGYGDIPKIDFMVEEYFSWLNT